MWEQYEALYGTIEAVKWDKGRWLWEMPSHVPQVPHTPIVDRDVRITRLALSESKILHDSANRPRDARQKLK